MVRLTLALLLALAALPAAAQVTGSMPAVPTHKRDAKVQSEIVRIGDLVDHAGSIAGVAIFRAPDLGQTGTVQAYRVMEAVRPHGLLIDTRDIGEVVVTRLSRVIPIKAVEARIAAVLVSQNSAIDAKNLLVTLDREGRPIQVESSAVGDLQPARTYYDPRTGRFDITFELPGSAAARRMTLRYTGIAVEGVEVAALQRALARGEVIRAPDVAVERRAKSEIGNDAVAPDTVVGLAARRQLRAGQAITSADVMKPEIVTRNEAVLLVFEAPGMLLTVRGKALDSGGEGDVVSVLNLQSKRTIQGVVSGPNRVDVTTLPRTPRRAASMSDTANPSAGRNE